MTAIPQSVTELVDILIDMPGTVAVVLSGSRAVRSDDEASDWDLGVYYRGEIDLTALSAFGTVSPPGSWGRVMNGGAATGLSGLNALFAEIPLEPERLLEWVDLVADRLGSR